MDINTFLDLVNNNPIQQYGSHEVFTDVTFALFRARRVGDNIEATGWWMNINYGGPIQNGYDTITIKGEDVHKWRFHAKFPKRNA